VSVVGGSGPYLYQLNDGEFQVSNVFENVSGGTHIVRVIDILGCTFLSTTVTVIKYMLFFTPNGDGYNDRWKINGLNQNDAKINIFDRYGKLIKEMTGINSNSGWDGTYNGDVLPASDYWFTIDFIENDVQRTFKAHFSLKR
jgi:gliding motility-associated-like protein